MKQRGLVNLVALCLLVFSFAMASALDWTEEYSYSDGYSEGGVKDIGEHAYKAHRIYTVGDVFNKIMIGKVKVVESTDDYSWYGARIALANPENPLERYEVRFNPESDKLQVNYVDRTNRTGVMSVDDEITVSEVLAFTECDIDENKWYYTTIMRYGHSWKVQVWQKNNPTCFLSWKDDRIESQQYLMGLQSAGKYVVSKFDKVFGA